MENDLRATDRISKGIQRSIALEYPIISYIRLQQLTWLVKFELLLNHFTKVLILVVSCLLQGSFQCKRVSKKYLAPSIYSYPYWRLKSNIRFYKGVFCLFGHPLALTAEYLFSMICIYQKKAVSLNRSFRQTTNSQKVTEKRYSCNLSCTPKALTY